MEEKLKILLCEDDENLGMLLREYLQAKGYTTELCPDGGWLQGFPEDKVRHLCTGCDDAQERRIHFGAGDSSG